MIKILLGSVGSGKTASCVRELVLNPSNKVTYSNIITNKIPNNIVIDHKMIVQKELLKEKRTGEKVYSYKLNRKFWEEAVEKHKSINVIIDEAHTILSSRKSMSKINQILTDWMALLRRVLGSTTAGYGELTLISQLDRRLDIIAREMATKVMYHLCIYKKKCKKCHLYWHETNETAEPRMFCPRCRNTDLIKYDHIIEVWHFVNVDKYVSWKYFGKKTYHLHYFITDIEKYFPYYNTLQWDNLIAEI